VRYTWALVLYPTVMKEKEKNKKRQKTNHHKDMLESDSAARAAAGDMHVLCMTFCAGIYGVRLLVIPVERQVSRFRLAFQDYVQVLAYNTIQTLPLPSARSSLSLFS